MMTITIMEKMMMIEMTTRTKVMMTMTMVTMKPRASIALEPQESLSILIG